MKVKVKKIAIYAACLLGMAACKKEAGYVITGNISGVEDGVVVYLENGNVNIDSAVMQGGQFRFEGKAEEPFYAGISIQKKEGMFGGKVFNLFVENADIRVDGAWDKLYEAQITGSSLHDLYEAFEAELDTLYEQRNQLQAEMWGVYTGYLYEGGFTEACIAPGIEVEKKSRAIGKQIEQACVDFIKTHPDSPVAIQAFKGLMGSMDSYTEQEVNDLLNLLAPNLKTTAAYAGLQERIQKARKFAKGKKFVDFKVVDANGKEGMFSDYVQPGKYNMLEVWASWCGHCRVEIPHLKLVQEKYGDRFNIIAVSWDKDAAKWREAMKEDNPNYLQLLSVADENGVDVGKAYGVNGIPFSLVLDGEGNIVMQEARAAALDLLLLELYGE